MTLHVLLREQVSRCICFSRSSSLKVIGCSYELNQAMTFDK